MSIIAPYRVTHTSDTPSTLFSVSREDGLSVCVCGGVFVECVTIMLHKTRDKPLLEHCSFSRGVKKNLPSTCIWLDTILAE